MNDTTPITPVAPAPAVPQMPPAPAQQRGGQMPFRRGRGGGMQGGRGGGRGQGRFSRPQEKSEYESKTIDIARVARVTKGGKRFSFRATVIIGNMKGKVGLGMAKGRDVAQSIQKATHQAKKHLIQVPIIDGTIPYQVTAKYHSAVVIIKPSRSGIKAGGPVRVVAQLSGINSLTGKLTERTNNKINIAMATLEALKKIRVKAKEAAPIVPTTESVEPKQ